MDVNIVWNEYWIPITNDRSLSIWQRELDLEIGEEHPLWGLEPKVIGRGDGTDDAIVCLNNNKFAIVHLVWNGKIAPMPDKFPVSAIYSSVSKLQQVIDEGAW